MTFWRDVLDYDMKTAFWTLLAVLFICLVAYLNKDFHPNQEKNYQQHLVKAENERKTAYHGWIKAFNYPNMTYEEWKVLEIRHLLPNVPQENYSNEQ